MSFAPMKDTDFSQSYSVLSISPLKSVCFNPARFSMCPVMFIVCRASNTGMFSGSTSFPFILSITALSCGIAGRIAGSP